jgi:hypothetical protein
MTDDRDPQLLQLFSNQRRLLEGELFVTRVVSQIEFEEKERAWHRVIWLAVVLCTFAVVLVFSARGFAFLSRDFLAAWQVSEAGNELILQWMSLAIMTLAAFAFATVWRLVRSDRHG